MMPQIFFEGNKLNRGLQQKRFVSMVVCLFSINWKDYMLPKNTLEASEQIVLKHHTYVHKHTHVLAKTPPQREPVTPGDFQHAFENHVCLPPRSPSPGPGPTRGGVPG